MQKDNGRVTLADRLLIIESKIDALDERLDKYFGPDGFCDHARRRVNSNKAQVIIQWFLLGAVIVAVFLK